MELLKSLDSLNHQWRGGCVTVGNFDGVHRGHLQLLQALRRRADQLGGPAIVFTFDPPPLALIRPQVAPVPLTWLERKAELLAAQGVDVVLAYPTDRALLELTDEQFIRQILHDRIGARAMVEGPNFRFGRDRAGDVNRLADLCQGLGIDLEIVAPLDEGGTLVSSTRIRGWLGEGDIERANRWLTAPYRLRGTVVRGDQRGRELGFPTANLAHCRTLIPGEGVYAGATRIAGRPYRVAIHVGPNVTFGQSDLRVEAHVLDYSSDLYGQTLDLEFLARIRGIEKFDSVPQLIEQMQRDVEFARNWSA